LPEKESTDPVCKTVLFGFVMRVKTFSASLPLRPRTGGDRSRLSSDRPLLRLVSAPLLWAAVLPFAACSRPAPAPAPPPTPVGIVTVAPEKVALVTELPGRINPLRVAEVRARVAGILTKRVFVEGSEVQAGQVLALIDPAPFQATLDSARAALAKAKANLKQYEAQAARYGELAPIHAVSQQEYDNAVAAVDGGKSDVATAQANVVTAQLNLGYATLTAPISGRIGRELVTEGALVGQNEATEIASIQQLDPIYFDFTESSADLLRLRRSVESGQLQKVDGQVKVTLLLEDGSTYRLAGHLLFSDITVDETTGMVSLRAVIPNPDRLLLPGMYARGRLEQAVDQAALTVPVRGVEHNPDGSASVMVVNAQNQVEVRPVQLGSVQGDKWIVQSGLSAGDRVIVEGLQKIGPGMPVTAVPFSAAPAPAAPAAANP
jgi:membrane fusion protein (multidrug efflux system)